MNASVLSRDPKAAPPELTIVIPAFNEADRILPTLREVSRFLAARPEPAEVLVVDDGSTDDTAGIVRSFPDPAFRLIENPRNRGKGYSIRRGVLEARGTWILFTDADLSTPIGELDALFREARAGAQVVIGSRALDRSRILVHQSRFRELGGIFFNLLVRIVLRLPIADTQCGFKLFRRDTCTRIFELQRVRGFGFDPEILYLARRTGLKIREVPVTWRNDQGSKVRFLRDATVMFLNLAEIRWNWLAGRYQKRAPDSA